VISRVIWKIKLLRHLAQERQTKEIKLRSREKERMA
jgi:hypothetical protein